MLRTGVLSGALVVVLALCGAVQAEMIAVPNSGFETQVVADNAVGPKDTVTNWTCGGGGHPAVYVWNPKSDRFNGADGSGTPQGGDGVNVLYLGNDGATGNVTSVVQMLSDTVKAGTYTLTVGLGQAKGFTVAAHNVICIQGGTAWAAYLDVLPAEFVSGQFVDRSVTFEVAADSPLIGQSLGVRLQTSLSGTAARITCFDNVRLEYTPVPEPGTLVLTTLGAFLFSKRRK